MPSKTRPDIALIDGDILLYRAGFAVEKKHYSIVVEGGILNFENKTSLNKWFKDNKVKEEDFEITTMHIVEPLSHALHLVNQVIGGILEKLGVSKYEVYLSGNSCFRNTIAVTRPYKGNRDTAHKPVHYEKIREYLQTQYGSVVTREIEADDALGIAHSSSGYRSHLVSNDKDLRQIPGWNYNPFSDGATPEWISPKDADIWFYTQVLTGDSVDNIVGIPGIGPVKAAKMLSGAKSSRDAERITWECYKSTYGPNSEGSGSTEYAIDRFLESARLVRILRTKEEEENVKKKIYWNPTIELN